MDYTKKLLEVRDLHKAYSKEGVPTKALNGITFDVLSGEYLGIMGASGSGKTTLLNCIATVIKPTSGQILLSGANISAFDGAKLAEYRGNRIGYLFQDFALLDNLTGRENILLPLSIHNIDSSIAEKHLNDIAGFLGITDVLSKFPAQMSGGQKQRVAAARSLISNPDIILADEPTGALDTKAARLLMEKLQEVNQVQGRTILMVSRLGATHKDYFFEPLSILEICREAVEDNLTLLEEAGFSVEYTENDAQVIDKKGLMFILGQIISNSVKYTGNNPAPRLLFSIADSADNEQISLSMKDNGTSIPLSDLPFVFDKGFTGDTGSYLSRSTGMGLYLVQKMATDLSITVELKNNSCGGTTVTLTFPKVERPFGR